MKFLCSVYNWFGSATAGIAGGEIYLSRLIEHLQTKGHEFRIITAAKKQYEHNGIMCYPQGDGVQMFTHNNEHCIWADVILSQLIGSAYGYNKAVQHKKNHIWIAHNNSTGYPIQHGDPTKCHVIYNSYQAREDLQKTFGQFNSTVLHPIIKTYSGSGNKITLINCSQNKGGHIFGKLAEMLPGFEFLGVYGGYQDQIEVHGPNIAYLPNGTDMDEVYKETRLLLCPSEFESYGQCAAEALTAGIPVIAHPTPGLKENLSYAGTFIDRNQVERWAEQIKYFMYNQTAYDLQSKLALQRAESCRNMTFTELNNFDMWLDKIVK